MVSVVSHLKASVVLVDLEQQQKSNFIVIKMFTLSKSNRRKDVKNDFLSA